METITISIYSITGSEFCIEAEDGEKVYTLIKKAISEKRKVELSFQNVELLTTAFLNTAVGKLYKDFSEQEIKDALTVNKNISQSAAVSLKRVVETAKAYYNNPDALRDSINQILED